MRLLCALLIVGLGAAPALAAKIELPGQVTYRERIALPDHASLEIQLFDETFPSLPPRLDVKAPIGQGQVPLAFTLAFDNAVILPDHSYALIASISDDTGLLFRNFQPYPVNPLAPAQPVVIVTNLVGSTQTGASSSVQPTAPTAPAILDSVWHATSIGGAAVLPRTVPTLTIGDDLRAGGSGGCNSWFAQAQIDRDTVRFGAAISTKKACAAAVDQQEQAFHDALSQSARWQVDGNNLTLFAADGSTLLTLSR
jgi:putative lipoprotein